MAYDPHKKVDLAKLRTVCIGASAVPSRRGDVNRIAATEKRWDKDFPAYRRLRAEGLRPRSSDGAAEMEARATERHHIEDIPNPKALERAAG